MSTKPAQLQEEKLPRYVRNNVDDIMRTFGSSGITGCHMEVPPGELIEWEEVPTFNNLHYTKVTFYGWTRLEAAYAVYQGMFGIWEVRLSFWTHYPTQEEGMRLPCVKTYGTPICRTPSDEWRETREQRIERLRQLIQSGIL